MLVSKTGRYALQAAADLAAAWEAGTVSQAAEIAERTGMPRNYLSKLLHQLARAGVLNSERGPGGGFRLAREPARISLAEIIDPVDPAAADQHCLLGRPACRDSDPCQAHERWSAVSGELHRFLAETSVADLAAED